MVLQEDSRRNRASELTGLWGHTGITRDFLYMYPTRDMVAVITFVLATTSMFESGCGGRQQAIEQMEKK